MSRNDDEEFFLIFARNFVSGLGLGLHGAYLTSDPIFSCPARYRSKGTDAVQILYSRAHAENKFPRWISVFTNLSEI